MILNTIILEATPEEIEKIKNKFRAASYTTTRGCDYGALFDKIDTDKSGSLDVAEFGAVIKKFCPDIHDVQIKQLLKDADKDGNGTLDRQEFIEFLNEPAAGKKKDEEEEISEWEKAILEPRETLSMFAELMRLNKQYHIEQYRIPRNQYVEAQRQRMAEEEARLKAEAEKLAAEKAAEEATVKAVLSSDDYEHSDNSTEGEHEREDGDEVLLESTSASVTSSIAST